MTKIGENLAKFFLEVIDDYKIADKVNCITTDNASNNFAMGDYLEAASSERSDLIFHKNEQMIGCFNHIINLACQELIVKGLKSKAPPDTSNLHYMMKHVNIIYIFCLI